MLSRHERGHSHPERDLDWIAVSSAERRETRGCSDSSSPGYLVRPRDDVSFFHRGPVWFSRKGVAMRFASSCVWVTSPTHWSGRPRLVLRQPVGQEEKGQDHRHATWGVW